MISTSVSKLATKVLTTNILYSKLVSKRLRETNSENKVLVAKTLILNGYIPI